MHSFPWYADLLFFLVFLPFYWQTYAVLGAIIIGAVIYWKMKKHNKDVDNGKNLK